MLNKWDERKIQRAIIALENSPCENTELAKWIYTVAFSTSIGLEGTPSDVLDLVFNPQKETVESEESTKHTEEVAKASVNVIDMLVPCLYKSDKITDEAKALIEGKSRTIKADDFAVGDLLFTDKASYIFDGESLVELCRDGVVKTDVKEALGNLKNEKRYAVLRPAQTIKINPSTEWSTEGFSEKQMAVVTTAEQYLLRGMRVQYDDTRFLENGEYRWQHKIKGPEDYTLQEWGYTNCAAFCVDVHRVALGYKTSYYSTYDLVEAKSIRPYYYEPTFHETDEEKARVKEEFLSALEPGDIIIIRRVNGSGHAMLYVGCGDIIHSSGGNYNYGKGKETYEPTVRQMRAIDLFTPEVYPSSYIFEKVKQLAIIRPIMKDTTAVTPEAAAYMGDMYGIVAEKLSSHVKGNTVNLGEEITYTVSLFNTNDKEVTLPVEFAVPEFTTLVSGELSTSVTVGALEKEELVYKVRVNDDTALLNKKWVVGTGTFVGGVEVKCPDVKIGRTLTLEEQVKILSVIDSFKSNGNAIDGANAVYTEAFGTPVFEETEFVDIRRGFFNVDGNGLYAVKKAGGYSKMLVHPSYGGRSLSTPQFDHKRTRLVKPEHLVLGDLILIDGAEGEKIYIFANEYILDLAKGERIESVKDFLEGLLSTEKYFGIVRPSLNFK